jgi:hypothetical protein
MLLDIEARIGELAEREPPAQQKITSRDPRGRVEVREVGPPKHERRLGIPE